MTPTKTTISNRKTASGAELRFEQTLWATTDKMCGHVDEAKCKHIALGAIFLNYILDAFQDSLSEALREQQAD